MFTDSPVEEETIRMLWLLAGRDYDLVIEAVTDALEEVRPWFWQFWKQPEWRVNIKRAMDYIQERRKVVEEDIKLADDIYDK